MSDSEFDIAIVGAGMAGLTCAQQLHQAGYRVVVVDKSRGLGGRMATRRLQGTHADHGVCYLKPKDERFQALLDRLLDRKVLRVWTDSISELNESGHIQVPQTRSPRYASTMGITAIAKFLATGLTIRLNHRVESLQALDSGWKLNFEDGAIAAKSLVIAIPAPQAAMLLETLPNSDLLPQVQSVEFDPCITAIAVYPHEIQAKISGLNWQAIASTQHPNIGWIGIDSSKQLDPVQPVLVIQSNATFAKKYLEAADLQDVGQQLLNQAADIVVPWVASPETLQVHRWRYAFAKNPLPQAFVASAMNPLLVSTGDWCGGNRVESAFLAGLATADYLNQQLDQRSLPSQFWSAIA